MIPSLDRRIEESMRPEGKTKACNYKLPKEEHVYGLKNKDDKYGVGVSKKINNINI